MWPYAEHTFPICPCVPPLSVQFIVGFQPRSHFPVTIYRHTAHTRVFSFWWSNLWSLAATLSQFQLSFQIDSSVDSPYFNCISAEFYVYYFLPLNAETLVNSLVFLSWPNFLFCIYTYYFLTHFKANLLPFIVPLIIKLITNECPYWKDIEYLLFISFLSTLRIFVYLSSSNLLFRYTPSMPTRELFVDLPRDRCVEHESGDASDCSNFVDLDWLSSSGNSCEEELLER